MSQPIQSIDADAFFASLRDRSAAGVSNVTLDGGQLPVSVRLQESSAVVFTFVGAGAQIDYPLPRFAAIGANDYVSASIIALSDPTLTRDIKMIIGWYAGYDGFELQKVLPEFFRQVIDSLGATRVVFVGSSGGGFAALYYSWQIPGSVAVVSNPQTNVNAYIETRVAQYRAACWPSLKEDDLLDSVIDANLGPLYAKRRKNTVVYLQVASDFFHLARHLAPFFDALPRAYRDRLVVRVSNWGMQGHLPVPPNIWIPWINAALKAPTMTATAIEAAWAEDNLFEVPPPKRLSTDISRDKHHADELARAAADALFGQQMAKENPL